MRKIRMQMFAEGGEGAQGAEGAAAEGTAEQTAETGTQERIRALEQQLGDALERLKQQEEPEVPEEPEEEPLPRELVDRHWQSVDRLYDAWMQQAEEVKQLYPGFDLRTELRDRRFFGMLRAGVGLRDAYQALHSSEIIPAAMQYAARQVQQQMASAMAAGVTRPAENGLLGGGAVSIGSNVAHMTRQDYDRVCRMVERGERVSFG